MLLEFCVSRKLLITFDESLNYGKIFFIPVGVAFGHVLGVSKLLLIDKASGIITFSRYVFQYFHQNLESKLQLHTYLCLENNILIN